MMGDNRDNSTDSRFREIGPVPNENLVGRARIIFMSIGSNSSNSSSILPFSIRWSRFFDIIR
jgi:signal peptidase I